MPHQHHIKAYHRPADIEEALKLLSRPEINSHLIGGGTYLTAHMGHRVEEIVDLQAVGLTELHHTGQSLSVQAMVTIQQLIDDDGVPDLVRETALREGPNTLRNQATLGGTIVGHDRESELLAALLVFETSVTVRSIRGQKQISLENFLRDVPTALDGGIITEISLSTMGKTASERVARTPADKAIVAAVARKEDENLYLALCGVASTPVLVTPANIKAAINPPSDFRGSREYRRHMAATLAQRVIHAVS